MTMVRHPATLALGVLLLAACPGPRQPVECIDETSCGLAAGGQCLVNPATGNQFCAYPDGTCPGGLRWSDFDVEEDISGACVVPDLDAGTDAPPDAAIDAPISECQARIAFSDGAAQALEVYSANQDGTGVTNLSASAARLSGSSRWNIPSKSLLPTWAGAGACSQSWTSAENSQRRKPDLPPSLR